MFCSFSFKICAGIQLRVLSNEMKNETINMKQVQTVLFLLVNRNVTVIRHFDAVLFI